MIPKDVYHEGKRPVLRVRLMDTTIEDIPNLPWTFWDVACGLVLGLLVTLVIVAIGSLFCDLPGFIRELR